MSRLFPITMIAVLLAVSLVGLLPVAAQDNVQEPTLGTIPVPEEMMTGTFESTTSIYLPLITGSLESDNSVQDPQETESVAANVLGEEPSVEASEKSADARDDISAGQVPPDPGLEQPMIESADLKADVVDDEELIAPAAVDGWTTIKSEGFEGAFPNPGWRVLDSNGSTNGEYYWDDTSYMSASGSWSAWAARGGTNALDPRSYNYQNNMRSWMIYGPFDLSNAADAELLFSYWNRSEANYDYFKWLASVDGTNFYGYQFSGDSGGWRSVNFDLTAVPTLGNLKGRSAVWVAFYFQSDGSVTNKGPFVDSITLQKLVNTTVTCPNQYKAEYFNNRTLSGSPIVTRCENWPINYNWGSGSPVSGIGSDNFSVRWTGNASINAGTYTFSATADDGIRVWLDNLLLIDAWADQGPTTYRVNRSLSSGNHNIKVEYYENGGGAVAQFAWSPVVTNGVPGITHKTRDGFDVFKIDMQSANLSFETVMAMDSTNVNQGKNTLTNPRELVSSMATRYSNRYPGRSPVLVFNADYSSVDNNREHGPEGLTVKNGVRFDGRNADPDDTDGNEWKKSSLSISSSKGIRIGKQTSCTNSCIDWVPDRASFYNTVGGGPLFIANGIRIGGTSPHSIIPCQNEGFTTSYCNNTSTNWTAAGVTQDGRYLIVVISSQNQKKTMDQTAAVLIAEGATSAIKLDGGGSSQVWYRDQSIPLLTSDRPISNAIMVFSSQ